MSEGRYLGNKSLISDHESVMAQFLRERNLATVNRNSEAPVVRSNLYARYLKRGLDIIVSLLACIVLFPFNLVFGICTFFDVGLPLFYKQTRCGKDGHEFLLVKFRNMRNTKDADGNLLPAGERVTKFGKIMRRYSLDELLNFWSILKGDMSLIGPRPLPMFFRERMSDRHRMREAVRPGLECPRMIPFTEEEIGYYQLQFENDIWYVENISLMTDIKMLFALVKMVFEAKDRSKHASVGTYFVGYNDDGLALSMRQAREQYPDIVGAEES